MKTTTLKSMTINETGLQLSRIMRKILTKNPSKAVVVEKINFIYFFLNLFSGLYINQEDFGYLYFHLPAQSRWRLNSQLNNIASCFISWKTFYDDHKYSDPILRRLAVEGMIRRAVFFPQARKIWEIAHNNPVLKSEEERILQLMKRWAGTFEQKIEYISISSQMPPDSKLKGLLREADNFFRVEQLLRLPGLPTRIRNRGAKKMFGFANSFEKLIKTHRQTIPGTRLRREIVAEIFKYEPNPSELLSAYYTENHWSNLKRALCSRIEQLSLTAKDWLDILLFHGRDRKLMNLVKNKLNEFNFESLNGAINGINEPKIREIILEGMFRCAVLNDSFIQLKRTCIKAGEVNGSVKVFRKSFAVLVSMINTPEEGMEIETLVIKNKNKTKAQVRRLEKKMAGLNIRFAGAVNPSVNMKPETKETASIVLVPFVNKGLPGTGRTMGKTIQLKQSKNKRRRQTDRQSAQFAAV